MRVQSITVDGYKSFGKTGNMLQVNPGTTTIVGMNGAGKSNLMDVIGSIDLASGMKMQGWQDRRNHALTQPITITVLLSPLEGDDRNVTGHGTTQIVLSETTPYSLNGGILDVIKKKVDEYDIIQVLQSGNYVNGDVKNSVIVKAREIQKYSSLPPKMLLEALKSTKKNVIDHIQNEAEKGECISFLDDTMNLVENVILTIPVFFYHSTEKYLKSSYQLLEIELPEKNNQNVSLSNKPNDLFLDLLSISGIDRQETISVLNTQDQALRERYQNKASRSLEEKVMKPFRKFYKRNTEEMSLYFRLDGQTLHVIINTGENPTRLNERSNGLRWYLNMFIDMLKSVDTNRPVVYVLDEPGIHLHINAQDELKHLFIEKAAEGTQFIYTTHSPYMIDQNFASIRSITKSHGEEFSQIHNSLYGTSVTANNALDTLSPIAAALGMDIRLTPGLSPEKLNVIVEGVTDQIYLNVLAQYLNFDMGNISIIPSTGADNIKHICGILLGWGFSFVAIFDHDDKGLRCCKELEEKMNLLYGKNCMTLKPLSEDEFHSLSKVRGTDAIVIESLIDDQDKTNMNISDHTNALEKKIAAVQFAARVSNGYQLSAKTVENFKSLFDRISSLI